jgi:NMD protein affecting ribosome stability and mRNA decay
MSYMGTGNFLQKFKKYYGDLVCIVCGKKLHLLEDEDGTVVCGDCLWNRSPLSEMGEGLNGKIKR